MPVAPTNKEEKRKANPVEYSLSRIAFRFFPAGPRVSLAIACRTPYLPLVHVQTARKEELSAKSKQGHSQSSTTKPAIAPSFNAASCVTNIAFCSSAVHAIIKSKSLFGRPMLSISARTTA